MIRTIITTSAVALSVGTAFAGGIDRSGQSVRAIFEETGANGGYAEFSFGSIKPSTNFAFGGGARENPLQDYTQLGFAVKQDLSENLSFTVIGDTPFGAHVRYAGGLPFGGGFADIKSQSLTALARYKFGGGFSVHGGVRLLKMKGQILSTPGALTASSDFDPGAVIGVAYEKPEIAMRVALTYSSGITNKLTGIENGAATNFSVKAPESWNLDFQSGVAANTLVFGSIRHVKWAGYNLTTPVGGNYVNFTNNATTYSLGVGRKINDNFSAALTLGYEKSNGPNATTPLAPTSGSKSIGLGLTYEQGNTKISGGVTYAALGDQAIPTAASTFTGAKAVAVGVRIGFKF